MRLIRATPHNAIFAELCIEWERQLRESEDAPAEFYEPMINYAKRIASEDPQDRRYGIFVLVDPQDAASKIFEGLVHINHAWPGTQHATLRVVWNLIAPRYQFEEFRADELARIKTGFIVGSMDLCRNEMPAYELKVYLGNAIDHEYAVVAAGLMQSQYPEHTFAVRGSWLHIRNTQLRGGRDG